MRNELSRAHRRSAGYQVLRTFKPSWRASRWLNPQPGSTRSTVMSVPRGYLIFESDCDSG